MVAGEEEARAVAVSVASAQDHSRTQKSNARRLVILRVSVRKKSVLCRLSSRFLSVFCDVFTQRSLLFIVQEWVTVFTKLLAQLTTAKKVFFLQFFFFEWFEIIHSLSNKQTKYKEIVYKSKLH